MHYESQNSFVPTSQKDSDKTKSNNKQTTVMIVAAEASSAAYAAQLLKGWKEQNKNIHAFGIGSREMEDLGFEIIGRSEELAVVGLQEIIAHWGDIKKAFNSLLEKAEELKPDVVVLMDYPEFNLRLASKLKKRGFKIAYYISPQIWAWRTYRVHKIHRIVDKMFVIFPFEEDFYKKHNVPAEFVGHPLLDMLDRYLPKDADVQDLRRRLLQNKKTILGLMPGSRKSELKHNLETQIATAKKITDAKNDVLTVMLVAPSLELDFVKKQCEAFGYTGLYIQEEPFKMICASDILLCASGTATLMVGLCRRPMVIMYKMNALSGFLARYLVTHIPFFGIVNLIMRREIVPERFQSAANPIELSEQLLKLIDNKEGCKDKMLIELDDLKTKLGDRGGIARLSDGLLRLMGRA
ncbi:MAG: lipid-A-disaccharide synthase [Bdellovibrionaceae bacterium]|nr:lipid-A-disaccharide synthase [Pseudobdellovibrionaceae bacterium]